MSAANLARGSGLIEVLIALVIMSVGLLGLASLQVSSMQRLQQARHQEAVTAALDDLCGRILANASLAKDGLFTFTNLANASAPSKDNNCIANNNCTAQQQALNELASWYALATTNIPALRFAISTASSATSVSGARVTLNLTWDAELTGNGSAECSDESHRCVESQLWIF